MSRYTRVTDKKKNDLDSFPRFRMRNVPENGDNYRRIKKRHFISRIVLHLILVYRYLSTTPGLGIFQKNKTGVVNICFREPLRYILPFSRKS